MAGDPTYTDVDKLPEMATQPCPACKFENEWGSEEVPHPIDPRVHECVIQKGQEAVDDALAKYREGLLPGYKRMPTVVGRLSFSREPEPQRTSATANIGDERLEWQVACTKALMESQERLAAEVIANIERANFNECRWQECAADYAKERARRQELEQQILKLTAERDALAKAVERLSFSPPPTPVPLTLTLGLERVSNEELKEAEERLAKLEHDIYLCSLGDRPQSPGVNTLREATKLREFVNEVKKAKKALTKTSSSPT